MPDPSSFMVGNAPAGASYAAPLVGFLAGDRISQLPEQYRQAQMRAPVIDPKTGKPTDDPNLILQALAERGGLQEIVQSGMLPYLYAAKAGASGRGTLAEAEAIAQGGNVPQGSPQSSTRPTTQAPQTTAPTEPAPAGSSATGPAGINFPRQQGAPQRQAQAQPMQIPRSGTLPAGATPTAQTDVGPTAPPSATPNSQTAQNLRAAANHIRKSLEGAIETPLNKADIQSKRDTAAQYDSRAEALEKADITANEPTGQIKEYNLYAKQQRQQGKPVLSMNQWQVQNAAEIEGAKAQTAKDTAFLDENRNTGIEAKRQLAQIEAIRTLSKKVGYGAIPSIQEWLGKWGVATAGLAPIQAYQAAISLMAPQLRPEGSGRLLQGELNAFKDSLGGLMRTPEGREIALNNLALIGQYKAEVGRIATDAKLSPSERVEKIYALDPPHLVTDVQGQKTETAGKSEQQQTYIRTATNPKTGHKIGQLPNGSLVDINTGKPIQ